MTDATQDPVKITKELRRTRGWVWILIPGYRPLSAFVTNFRYPRIELESDSRGLRGGRSIPSRFRLGFGRYMTTVRLLDVTGDGSDGALLWQLAIVRPGPTSRRGRFYANR